MPNLRIQRVEVVDSSNIKIVFTQDLNTSLVVGNVSIIADTNNVPDAEVLSVKIKGATLSLKCLPLSPLAAYFLTFQSVILHPFTSLHGEYRLSEDGVTNKYLIVAPLSSDNPVQNYLGAFYKDNIYNIDDDTTMVGKYVQSLSVILSRALYDIRQVKNENYLSFDVIDEKKIRGSGAFDRLAEEGAYDIIRLGRAPSSAKGTASYSYDEFPTFPITLQRKVASENTSPNSTDDDGVFNVNTLTLNLSSSPITKVTSIVFLQNTATPIFTYDITTLGYQIQNSRYDQDYAFSYATLEDNQVKLSEKILDDATFSLDNIIRVEVQYEHKNLGIVVDATTVAVTSIFDSIREELPPIINVFNLEHAPIVDSNGDTATLAGVTFTDPNTNVVGASHPAFTKEIVFRLNGLPALPGQYSIDYENGTVYVYGNDLTNSGTGPYPPLASYSYLYTFKHDQDYTYDSGLLDLVALPLGSLVEESGIVDFNYEEVLVPGLDYKAALHQEELSERVENRLVALNAFRTVNSPITNVFRIFNETSGEIYTLNRWNDDKVYFRYNNPPRVISQAGERVSFQTQTNEVLFANTTSTNTNSLRVFKILLNNNTIIGSTEDSIGSSFNSSVTFTDGNVFVVERWFNRDFTEQVNIDRLETVGDYVVDYINGIVYVAVSSTQDFNLGSVTYKYNSISPIYPHVISVEDIYYRFSSLVPKNKNFKYTSFGEASIVVEDLDASDELYLNESSSAPYQVYNNNVGSLYNASFVNGVTEQVKFVRGLFEYDDLLNNSNPINFANYTTFSDYNITAGEISKQVFDNVKFDGYDYYVDVNENIPYLSPNINFYFSVIRASDGQELWDNSGVIEVGTTLKLVLSGAGSPSIDELVTINYTFSINSLSRVVVDYNKGDMFADYTYVADEIIVSYEYGDNVIDFRTSKALSANTEYYVSYKVGALRDALLKNFGTLVNIPELTNFDVDFNRERYRDSLMAALSSFIQGPTLSAIKNIGKTISHIEPEVIESIFEGWSLGNSLLYPQEIETEGSFSLLPAKYGNGVLVNESNQTISLPVSSNIRLEEGTFETWVIPQWNGLDNDAELTFTITKDGYAIDPSEVFVGPGEFHPTFSADKFVLNKNSNVDGYPNMNKDGIFIYYNDDAAGNFKRWYVKLLDGYVATNTSNYKLKIETNGSFYDVKNLILPKQSNVVLFSGVKSVTLSFNGGGKVEDGITFISDIEHYMLDFGEEATKSRLSIFKDISGYMNFRVYDKNKTSYTISSDVSGWKIGDTHHVAASWKLNTRNDRDEMHLFIDGLEVPNIIKYGQKLRPYLHEKFRTINPEELAGLTNRDIVSSVDLHTILGSNIVTSSLNFGTYNISVGDPIYIDEAGFNTSGYLITNISGQTLTLDTTMPATLTDGRFSINRTEYTVTSEIDIVPNIAVSTIHVTLEGNDLSGSMGSDVVTSGSTIFDGYVLPGYYIRIDGDSSLPLAVLILQVSGSTLTLDAELSVNLSSVDFWIYSGEEEEIPGVRALRPSYSISKDANFNNILTISNNVYADDLILIKTLGLNFRKINRDYYVWSHDQENILMTKMPPPISLDEVKIFRTILPKLTIDSSNSTYSLGLYTSNNFTTAQPSNSQIGRTISVTISGNNVDFSIPAYVYIQGVSGIYSTSEYIAFNDYGTLDFANIYLSIDFVNVIVKPLNANKAALAVEIKEKYVMTESESSGQVPVIRFSYHMGSGYALYNDTGFTVRDENNLFSYSDIDNYLLINQPITVAGYYKITGVSEDRKTLSIESTISGFPQPLADFTDGVYQILNTTDYRSGLQGGYFTLESALLPSVGYMLSQGFYELEYATYTAIKFDPLHKDVFFGSNFNGTNQLNAIMDQVKVYSTMLTDTRIGESIPVNQRSITKDYNSLKALKSDKNTLLLINFDEFPFTNQADKYIDEDVNKQHFFSPVVVNENFGNSVVIQDKPIILSNDGILDTRKEGSIEFWTNPMYDTGNDPKERYYFDAYGAVIEDVTSVNDVAVKLSGPASQILSVKLQSGDGRTDYFAGGKIEIDTQRAIQESGISTGDSIVQSSKQILQVATVKIANDKTGTDYFADGSVGPDKRTIYLGKLLPANNLPVVITYQAAENGADTLNTQVIRLNRRLPYQNSKVTVTYIPKGLQGDRLAIYKDNFGFVNFGITASGTDYLVRAPTRWVHNTWHRVKASYKLNGGNNNDELRLFIDGYEFTNILFGTGIIANKFPVVMGSSMPGDGYHITGNIKFKDPINELFIGSEYTQQKPIFSLIDNFRISNISRPIYAPYGEPIDVNYSRNLDSVFPVTHDLYTTYLLDLGSTRIKSTDFALIKNRETGLFNFLVNIFDSFGIVSSSPKVQEVLEKLIKILKPANSRVFIKYYK